MTCEREVCVYIYKWLTFFVTCPALRIIKDDWLFLRLSSMRVKIYTMLERIAFVILSAKIF